MIISEAYNGYLMMVWSSDDPMMIRVSLDDHPIIIQWRFVDSREIIRFLFDDYTIILRW